jgi:hypothetical protein
VTDVVPREDQRVGPEAGHRELAHLEQPREGPRQEPAEADPDEEEDRGEGGPDGDTEGDLPGAGGGHDRRPRRQPETNEAAEKKVRAPSARSSSDHWPSVSAETVIEPTSTGTAFTWCTKHGAASVEPQTVDEVPPGAGEVVAVGSVGSPVEGGGEVVEGAVVVGVVVAAGST